MAILYKTLFEVKLEHEYYLTDKAGKTIFSEPSQAGRVKFLFDQYMLGKESINQDIQFEFPQPLQEVYKDYHLKLIPAYSGLKIMIRVNQKILADGTQVYEPFTPLPETFGIHVLFSKKTSAIDTYTNTRISSHLPAVYVFSNNTIVSNRVFPFLTSMVSPQVPAYAYEQGELVSFGAGIIRSYYHDGADKWYGITGTAFVNENDRLLLPLKFQYSFPASKNVTQALFTLKNNVGDTIKSFDFNSTKRLNKVFLDLSDKQELLIASETTSINESLFKLDVSGNDGYVNTHQVLINDTFYQSGVWGMASIYHKPINTQFNLTSADGYLIKRRNPAGIWTEAPVFEIPITSRFAFWRYINNRGHELKFIPALTDYLFKEDQLLLSTKPRSLSKSFFLLTKTNGTDPKYFPNPVSYDIKRDKKERLCFDIPVPRSDMFPIVV